MWPNRKKAVGGGQPPVFIHSRPVFFASCIMLLFFENLILKSLPDSTQPERAAAAACGNILNELLL